MAPSTGQELTQHFFDKIDAHTYKCLICEHDYKVSGSGFTNLRAHINIQHKPAYDDFVNGSCDKTDFNLDTYRYSSKCRQIYGWIEYIILTLRPFFILNTKSLEEVFHTTRYHSLLFITIWST